MIHIRLVDLSEIIMLHDLNENSERLLLRNILNEQKATNESGALAIADFGIVDRVGLHDVEQTLLTDSRPE